MDGLLVDGAIAAGGGGVMGRVQAVRATGTVVGQLLANLGGGALADAFGLPALAFFLAALALPWAAAPLALAGGVVEERARGGGGGGGDGGEARRSGGGGLGAARAACVGSARAFWSAPAAAALALSTLTFAGSTVGNFPLVLFLVGRKGLTLLDNGALNTVFAVAGWLGSLAAAWLLERGDVRVPTAVAQLTSAALTAAVLWTPAGHAFAFNAAINVVGGLATGFVVTVTNAVALRLSPRGLSATFVALIAGMGNVGGLLGNVLVGQIAASGDFFGIAFWTGAGLLAAGALAVPFLGAAAAPPLAALGAAGGAAAAAVVVAANPLAGAQAEVAGAPQPGVREWGSSKA